MNRRSGSCFVSASARSVRGSRLAGPSESPAQVGSSGVGEPVVLQVSPPSRIRSISRNPASGPSRIAIATARFNSTTGEGSAARSTSYRPTISAQSVCRGRRRLGMDARDRGLDRIGAEPPRRQRSLDEPYPLRYLLAIPEGPVLLVEEDHFSGRRRARAAPRFVQQHQREQSQRFRLRKEIDQQPSEPDRLARQVMPRDRGAGSRRISFIENEIDHA